MTLFVYVDNSNLWIEGRRVSAVNKGMATSLQDAMNRGVTDQTWNYDFGKLYRAICPENETIGRSSLFGSRPPTNDSLWQLARDQGFEVFTFDRNLANKEKQVDVAIATQIMADSYERMKAGDRIVLVTGDRDYLPTIESVMARGFPVIVAFWRHATGHELQREPVDFFALDPLFGYLTK
ncbi:NYN domain-containing protein [Pseudolysinimonas yzui]|uniref:NYN domain-containing protein n=1 Tax=Pseudolysinimonas yzui TaxID=2708254 RepID=A0A8J3M3I7_9MICO|nr:NYN domain-containing protein [Pseudolysinimonas yzui]GHF12536.1 hypothetical protein GCM10011600_11640 [Pseudolysinimonas yzui]